MVQQGQSYQYVNKQEAAAGEATLKGKMSAPFGNECGPVVSEANPSVFSGNPLGFNINPSVFVRKPSVFMKEPLVFWKNPSGFAINPSAFFFFPSFFFVNPFYFFKNPSVIPATTKGFPPKPSVMETNPSGLGKNTKGFFFFPSGLVSFTAGLDLSDEGINPSTCNSARFPWAPIRGPTVLEADMLTITAGMTALLQVRNTNLYNSNNNLSIIKNQ